MTKILVQIQESPETRWLLEPREILGSLRILSDVLVGTATRGPRPQSA